MLKLQVRKNVANTVGYFLSDPALSEEERRGVWYGRACEAMRLSPGSVVQEQAFRRILEGYDLRGHALFRTRRAERRAAWDCVITPDKTISVAGLCLDRKVASAVRACFEKAVRDLADAMQELACRRVGATETRNTGNFAFALFTHHLSRHNDPHLHTHLLLMNSTVDPSNGHWAAVQPSPLYRCHTVLNGIFNRELARHLRAEGLDAKVSPEGNAVLPVPKPICTRLSKAHASIHRLAREPRPRPLRGMNQKKWENYVNDRTRPSKTPLGKQPPLSGLLSDQERRQLRLTAPVRIRQLRLEIQDLHRRIEERTMELSLLRSQKAVLKAALDVSMETPDNPMEPFLRASRLIPGSPLYSPPGGSASPTRLSASKVAAWQGLTAARQKKTAATRPPPPIRRTEDLGEDQGMRL